MTGNPRTLIDPAGLPVDPATCRPVYPHQYLKVNTVFEVAHQAGGCGRRGRTSTRRTRSSTARPAPACTTCSRPEINSSVPGGPAGGDWTTDNAATQQYDRYKVQAVLNEIDGYDHSGAAASARPRSSA